MMGSHREMECSTPGVFTEFTGEDKVFSPHILICLYHEDKEGKLSEQKCMVYFRKNFISKIPVKIVMFCMLSVRSGTSLTLKTNLSDILYMRVYTQDQSCYVDRICVYYINPCPSPSHKV